MPQPTFSIKPGEGARIQSDRHAQGESPSGWSQSKGPVPHFYLNIDIDAGPLMAARAELKSAGEGDGNIENHR